MQNDYNRQGVEMQEKHRRFSILNQEVNQALTNVFLWYNDSDKDKR
jgi:hypothetical protein